MSGFDTLKASRQASITKLVTAAEKLVNGGAKSYEDNRFWAPIIDKSGNGYSIIRFLPAPAGEDLPWIRYWDHGFKGSTGRWYIENSLTSIGQTDPIGELNSKLWNTGRDEDKEIARLRKRRLHYVSNILVISDPANPANEGKVFLYKYGKKIFNKCNDIMQPQFKDEEPVNPFDFWTGANFKLKIRNFEGYRNYDKSEFDKPSSLYGADDKRLEEVYEKLYSLKEFLDPKNYKSYAELTQKLNQVLGSGAEMNSLLTTAEQVQLSNTSSSQTVGKTAVASESKSVESLPWAASASDKNTADDDDYDDSTLSYFAKLAKSV